MGDLKKVKSGDPLRIPAATFNTFIDSAKDYLQRSQNTKSLPGIDQSLGNLIYVKNNSGFDCDRFNVLGIDGPVFDPAEALDTFKNVTVLNGAVPAESHAGGLFVILAEPIATGSVGKAYCSGTCQVKIDITCESHQFADIYIGQKDKLKSIETGPLSILWKESGTGTKWSIVRFTGDLGPKLYRIESIPATAGYNCKCAHLDTTDPNNIFVTSKTGATAVTVINLAELSSTEHILSVGDILMAQKTYDHAGNSIYIGFSPVFAWWRS